MDTSKVEDFVGLSDLVQAGVNAITVRRRLRTEQVDVFSDPLDRRRRLIRREDADRLLKPRLIADTSAKGASA